MHPSCARILRSARHQLLAASALFSFACPALSSAATFSPTIIDLPRCLRAEQSINYTLILKDNNRQVPAAELRARGIKVEAVLGGTTVPAVVDDAKNGFTFPIEPGGSRRRYSARIDVAEGGSRVQGIPLEVDVLPTLQLRPPPVLGFGEVEAGCDAAAHCRPLDLTQSLGLWDGAKLVVFRKDAKGSAEAEVTVWLKEANKATNVNAQGAMVLWSPGKQLSLCVQPSSCASIPSRPLLVGLKVDDPCIATLRTEYCRDQPGCTSDIFGEVALELQADWRPTAWWTCNRIWVLTLLAVLILGLIIYGYVRPHRFGRSASIRIASKQSELKRASLRPLRACLGGRHGFYRSAVVSINAEGLTVRGRQPHVVQFRAGPGNQAELVSHGNLEKLDKGTFKPLAPQIGKSGPKLRLEPCCTYRVNGVIFFEVFY
jgi:hypothetical protein